MKCLTVTILIGILALYILIGGAIFFALERDNETSTESSTLTYYYNFLSKSNITKLNIYTGVGYPSGAAGLTSLVGVNVFNLICQFQNSCFVFGLWSWYTLLV